jgi:hypothetical protein
VTAPARAGRAPVTILELATDPALLGAEFGGESWSAWRTLLRVLFVLAPEPGDLELYRRCTGRTTLPKLVREAWAIVGRRGGKSRIAGLVAIFVACFIGQLAKRAPGERLLVAVIAADRRQARIILLYVKAFLAHPLLRPLVEAERADGIDLRGGVAIEVTTASFRTSRGYTLLGAIVDEAAFLRDEASANPDAELLAALRPGLATTRGLLLVISSPYARRGVVWQAHERHFGRDDSDVLVWEADSRTMNPSLPREVVEAAFRDDAAAAASEYGRGALAAPGEEAETPLIEFRSDVSSFVDRELVEQCVNRDRPLVLLPRAGVRYVCACDSTGGRVDYFVLVCLHLEGTRIVIDGVWVRKPPLDPREVAREFSSICARYGVRRLVGDYYSAEWCAGAFREFGMTYVTAEKTRSELLRELLPVLSTRGVELPPDDALVAELASLERRVGPSGRESIQAPAGLHDDRSTALATGVYLASREQRRGEVEFFAGISAFGREDDSSPLPSWWPRSWPVNWRSLGDTPEVRAAAAAENARLAALRRARAGGG